MNNPNHDNIGWNIFAHSDREGFNAVFESLSGNWQALPNDGSRLCFLMAAARFRVPAQAEELARLLSLSQIELALQDMTNFKEIEPAALSVLLESANSVHSSDSPMTTMLAAAVRRGHEAAVDALCNFSASHRVPINYTVVRNETYNNPDMNVFVKVNYNRTIAARIIRATAWQEIGNARVLKRDGQKETPGLETARELANLLKQNQGRVTESNVGSIIEILSRTTGEAPSATDETSAPETPTERSETDIIKMLFIGTSNRTVTARDLDAIIFESAFGRVIPLREAILTATLAGIENAPSEEARAQIREVLFHLPTSGEGSVGPDYPISPKKGPGGPGKSRPGGPTRPPH